MVNIFINQGILAYVLAVIIICVLAFVVSVLFDKNFGLSLVFSIFSVILIIYVLGLCQIMIITPYLLSIIAIALLVFTILKLVKNKEFAKRKIKILYSTTFIIFIAFAFLQIFTLYGRLCNSWDEFSHWGLICKNMFIFKDFGNGINASIIFRGYPPATGLFSYFIESFGSVFVEANLYRAFNILNVAIFLAIIDLFEKKWLFKTIAFFVLILVAKSFYLVFNELYVDAILAIMFAFILLFYFFGKEDKFKLFLIPIAMAMLTLIKEVGFSLSLMAIIIIAIDLLIFNNSKIIKKKKWIWLVILIVTILIAKYSWAIFLKATNNPAAWDTSALTIKNILDYIFKPTQYQTTITDEFIKSFITKTNDNFNYISFSYLFLILICIAFFVIIGIKNKRKLVLGISLGGMFIVYAFGLLLLYILTYGAYEAMKLASFNRYLNTFALSILLIMAFEILILLGKIKSKTVISVSLILSFLIFPTISTIEEIVENKNLVLTIQKYRATMNYFSDFAQNLDNTKDKIYLIDSGSTGYISLVARFSSVPVKTQLDNWSLGEKRRDGDVWSVNLTIEQWNNQLINEGFTYVCVHNADAIFISTYGSLFEDEIINETFYKVNINNNSVYLTKA